MKSTLNNQAAPAASSAPLPHITQASLSDKTNVWIQRNTDLERISISICAEATTIVLHLDVHRLEEFIGALRLQANIGEKEVSL
ncbi:MAG: hypothetical protein LBQ20_03450 [Rhodanobacter sp.]|jgi:hypothetical protein|nr:hypothetical protein [Rhodanobacter sp.]